MFGPYTTLWCLDRCLVRALAVLLLAWSLACTKKPPEGSAGAPASLVGKVASASGQGLAADTQVLLELRGPQGIVARKSTTVGGAFAFTALTPGVYSLLADASGQGSAAVTVQLGPFERVHTVLRLQEPAHVEGVVVDRRGYPVPAALVLVWPSGDEASHARETTTDEKGRFAVSKLAATVVTVLVQAPGIGSVKWEAVPLPSRPLRAQLEGEGRSVRGELVGARGSLADFRVRLGGVAVRQLRTATPDAQGRFVFHGMGPGDYKLRAGSVSQASTTQNVAVGSVDVTGVKLALQVGEVISGRVVDGNQQALPGAKVVVQSIPADDCAELATTDVVGYFSTVALPRGKYEVQAMFAGFVAPAAQAVNINARPTALTLQLHRASRVYGRVLLPGGNPAHGAEVVLLAAAQPKFPRDRVPVVAGNLPLAAEAAARGPQALPHVMSNRGVSTDERGVFTIGALRPGSFALRITHAEAGAVEVEPRNVGEGSEVDFGVLTLPAPAAVPTAEANQVAPTITPALAQGNRSVKGVVRDPRGRPLADVALTVRPLDPQAVPLTSATTAGNGAFTVTGLPEVALIVRAQHREFGVLTHNLAPDDKAANLKYPAPGGIEGEIVDAQGRFVSGAQVSLVGPEGMPGPPVPMTGAGFRVLGLPPGDWTIKAVVPGFSAAQTTVQVPPGESPREPSVRGIRLKVTAGG